MKKNIFIIIMIFVLAVAISCTKEEKVKVLLPGGTPLLAVGGILDDKRFEFTVVNGQDPLLAGFKEGKHDIIIAPLNLGAKLYIANISSYKLDSIITSNNTYLVSTKEINGIKDIEGKKVLAYGNGSTPSLVLNSAISLNNISANIEYRNSVSDVMGELLSGKNEFEYFLSDEPNISKVKASSETKYYTYDLSTAVEASIVIHASLFVNDKVDSSTLNVIKENINKMNSKPEEYSNSIVNKNEYFKNLGVEVIKMAIPNANITYKKASESIDEINEYYNLLNKYLPNVLNGKVPEQTFYN